MSIDDELAYIFGPNTKLKGKRPLTPKVKQAIESGKVQLPRLGVIPEGEEYLDQNVKTPILMRLQSPAPYNVYLTIPARYRKKLKWDKGTLVSVEQMGEGLFIKKVDE